MTKTTDKQMHPCAETEDSLRGYEFWLERLRSWQSEVRETLFCLTKVQQALLEHEEVVNQHLSELHTLETSTDCDDESRAYGESHLRGYYHRARRRQESLQQSLDQILEEFAAIEPVPAIPSEFQRLSPVKDRVNEASWESFPASDPPSTNPG